MTDLVPPAPTWVDLALYGFCCSCSSLKALRSVRGQ
ncbi:hypothetical protein J2X28_000763 [Kocuria rhizophila]|nr:hypothetical protein [Kocuria rhizophila]